MNETEITTLVGFLLTMINPLITAIITKPEQATLVKRGVSIALAVGSGALTAWSLRAGGVLDWAAIISTAIFTAQGIYHLADDTLKDSTGKGLGRTIKANG